MNNESQPDRLANCHRLSLSREWIGTGGTVNWIMLNPSTADWQFDDPTIRKCIGFSRRWGFWRMTVTNLFTFRATDPNDLKVLVQCDYARAVGYADAALIQYSKEADMTVCAWGNHGDIAGRANDVLCRVIPEGDLYCIGKTKGGNPVHPCRASYTDKPEKFRPTTRGGAE